MEIADIAKRLIAIESTSGKEREVQEWIATYLSSKGFNVELVEVLPGRPNLYARRGESKILFATHCDTVPAWEHPNAFNPIVKGNMIFGRGALDAKGQIASLLKAVEECSYPCDIAIFIDEEKDGTGSKEFLPNKKYEGAIVLEPTELKVAVGELGGISLEIKVKGTFAHGATPWAGKNAIKEALKIVKKLEDIVREQKGNSELLQPWINLGKIEGGRDSYVVPDQCSLLIELAILPGNRAIDTFERIKPVLQGTEYNLKDLDDPIEIERESHLLSIVERTFKSLKLEFKETFFPSWSDAHNLHAKGIPCIILGSGKLQLAHTPYEFADLKELETLKEIIKGILAQTKPGT